MQPPPYRHHANADHAEVDGRANGDLVLPLMLFWCISVIRVMVAVHRGETFGVFATLALVVALCVPLALVRSLRRIKKT